MLRAHSFHIPVMGIGFTIDTPLKVSQYGIDSVISIGDDFLLEKIRKMYCNKFSVPYKEINDKIEDFRAKRITSYLNLINKLVAEKFEQVKEYTLQKESELSNYLNMLPDNSNILQEFKRFKNKIPNKQELSSWLKDNLSLGSIDVNIMTKLDKENYFNGEKLSSEYNDAHAALRGYAMSDLSSSVVFSAGLNPRLYSYIEKFNDFFPNKTGEIKKKIVLKVSDYRSALIQGKFLAKKGLWVSEFRIESGLNCGGHAFATDGYLLGPILAEFRDKRDELVQNIHELYVSALSSKNRILPSHKLPIKVTAQGGVGTADEHQFLLNHYQLESVGWGSPFLLVPEATTVDKQTINKLIEATESDLYLSNISPLGIPFNNLRGNTKDLEKVELIKKGRPGSPCIKKHLILNKEFTKKPLCTASRKYQDLKIKQLKTLDLPMLEYKKNYNEIVDKACICTGLGSSTLLAHDLDTSFEGDAVSVCPGPNMAYFSKQMTLHEIIDHIYGRKNVITNPNRPNFLIKELDIYINYIQNKIDTIKNLTDKKQKQYFKNFADNLTNGVNYYITLFNQKSDELSVNKNDVLSILNDKLNEIDIIKNQIENLYKESIEEPLC